MRIPVFRHGQIAVLACGIGLAGVFLAAMPGRAFALTPKSPEVVAAIEKGVKFLESSAAPTTIASAPEPCWALPAEEHRRYRACQSKDRRGGRQNPEGVGKPRRRQVGHERLGHLQHRIVRSSFSWNSTASEEKYRPDIECLLAYLRKRQKPHGGWGYEGRETGDTSMTQYGVLSSWVATKARLSMSRWNRSKPWRIGS